MSVNPDQARILPRLYLHQRQGAVFRTAAISLLWFFSLFAYYVGALRSVPFFGITVSVALLAAVTLPALRLFKRIEDIATFEKASLAFNAAEALVYTAAIHFMGGVEGVILVPAYGVLITYLGMVAPRRFPFILAGWSSFCFAALVALEHYGILAHYPLMANLPADYRPPFVNELPTVLTAAGFLFMLAYISAATSEARRRDRRNLRRQNRELERIVDDRTAALTRANRKLQAEVEERSRAENAFRRSEEKYRTILERIEEGFYEVDLAGNFTLFNEAMRRILGRPADEILGRNSREFSDEGNFRTVFVIFNRVYRTGEPSKGFDWELKRKDGSRVFVETSVSLIRDDDGSPIGFRGISRDVTERKLMESELIETRDRLQSIFDSSTDGILTTDLHGRVRTVSPRIADILGYAPEDVVGKRVEVLYSGGVEDAREVMEELEEKGEIKNREMKLHRKDGQAVEVSLSGAILRDVRGNAVGSLGVYRDISEARRLEAQLQQAQKFEAIGTLAGGLAHDFNNLLMGIQGAVSLMLHRAEPEHPNYQGLKNIERQIQSGARLTAQLLGYARKGMYELRAVDLNQLIRDSAETFGRARRQIAIRFDLADDVKMVLADPGQIEQVLFNLFVNAADAMPDGGDLTLRTSDTTAPRGSGAMQPPASGEYVEVSVSDTGTGMAPEVMERIFDPFFTTKEMGRGTGLGLASCYGIVRAHGGYIDVASEPGRGSVFAFYLRATDRAPQQPAQPAPAVQKGQGTVLIVDDEAVVLEVAAELLEELGYRVFKANNGNEALEIFQAQKDEIDLVVMDMIMPGLSGGDLYDSFKQLRPEIKVLLCSGYSIEGQAREIMARGCRGFLQKPFTLEEFSKKVREVMKNGRGTCG